MADAFAGKVVWITGASSGIDRALALAFDRAGAQLILSGRRMFELGVTGSACRSHDRAKLLPFDLADLGSLPGIAERAVDLWGRVDVMVHNAGVALRSLAAETPTDLDQKVLATNYSAPVALTRALLPGMLERGSGCFVVVSSLSGKYGVPTLSSYAASKHALHGYFESLRAEVADRGIQVTVVVPGFIRTNIVPRALTKTGGQYGKSLPAYERGLNPEVCAERIVRAVSRRRREVLIGGWELSSVYLNRFFPGLWSVLVRNHPVRTGKRILRALSFGLLGKV